MTWNNPGATQIRWSSRISKYEEKLLIGEKIAEMVKEGDVIGAGAGSSAFVALQEISKRVQKKKIFCKIIPASREIEMAATALGLLTTTLLNDKPDWHFDGADEVDPEGNLLKGRGGAMYREKLIMSAAEKTYILVDSSKFVDSLGENFAIPVETDQEAAHYVENALVALGAEDVMMRFAEKKDGPVITEKGNFILDARFYDIGPELEHEIKNITGVLESGLFWEYDPEIVTV